MVIYHSLIGLWPSEVANIYIITSHLGVGGRRIEVEKKRTFTTLSQPHETMTGFITLGLKRTQDTLQRLLGYRGGREKRCSVPLGVAIFLDVVLALTESVPELDGPVA